jgi:hypothetical protein
MQQFLARENIKRFRAQLLNCTDVTQRSMLERLLADEEANLKAITLGISVPRP